MIPAFPKINTLGTKYVAEIWDDVIEITEKVDGSQIAWGKIDGVLYIRSRGKIFDISNPDKMFKEGVSHIKSIEDKLEPNYVYYAEYLQKPKHNTLCYSRIPKNHLMLFGMSNIDQTFVGSHRILASKAKELDIDVAPILFEECKISKHDIISELHELLKTESYLGGSNIEGVVIKNYFKSLWMGDRHIPIMAAKFVSEAFKEVHGTTWSKDHTSMGGFEGLKESYRSEARWMKAIHALRDVGCLRYEPRDIGEIIKYIHTDIEEEEKETIKDKLWTIFGKNIIRNSSRGMAEFYKEWLIKESINDTNNTA